MGAVPFQRAASTRVPLVLDRARQTPLRSAEDLWGHCMNCVTQIIVMLLQTVGKIFERYRDQVNAEAEIAKHAAAVLRMTKIGNALLQKVEEMHDEELDDFLKELGRG